MPTIQETFKTLKENQGKAFIPYITAGDPHIEQTPLIVETLARAGADIIELGVPFSDPIADGPTNQLAAERSLAAGTDLNKVLNSVKIIRGKGIETPIVLFTYLNPLMAMGFEKFAKRAQEVGVQGLLIVDLPPESAIQHLNIKRIFDDHNLETIFLASPTTEKEKLPFIDDSSKGFVYYVSRTGITGARNSYSDSLLEKIKDIKASIKNPLAVGFGISTPQQAREIATYADGVIVGSALVKIIEKEKDMNLLLEKLFEFAKSIKDSISEKN